MERQKEEEDAIEAERRRKADLAMALKEQEKMRKMEQVTMSFLLQPSVLMLTFPSHGRNERLALRRGSSVSVNETCVGSYMRRNSRLLPRRIRSWKSGTVGYPNGISRLRLKNDGKLWRSWPRRTTGCLTALVVVYTGRIS